MKLLEKKDINLVKPKFKQMVLDAWGRGEGVPYGVVYLSEAPLTRKEAQRAKELIKQYQWEK
jgi:hypothetical protein